jgi:hypothetical protein
VKLRERLSSLLLLSHPRQASKTFIIGFPSPLPYCCVAPHPTSDQRRTAWGIQGGSKTAAGRLPFGQPLLKRP